MPVISAFDPWQNNLCKCPAKLTLNPYTGCSHGCLYCYASSYIPNFSQCRPKTDLLQTLGREATKLKGQTIMLSASSDPYPPQEAALGLTRRCLEILSRSNCRLEITTKSNLVSRDDDLLQRVPSIVAFTITMDNDELAGVLEPGAPSPNSRIRAAQDLIAKGIPVIVRIDPIIPFVNEHPESLVGTLADMGVQHVTCSTYKPKPDNWRRISQALPSVAEKLKPLYFQQGERIGGNTYLPKELRHKILKETRDLVSVAGMRFGVCREGLDQLNMAVCDGSWLFAQWRGEPTSQPKLTE